MALTHHDRLVLVMAELEDEFDEWTLTVKAWQMYPEYYGLRGYKSQYPDHKMVCNIYQKPGGPVGQGHMEKVRKNVYRMLPAGVLRAQQLSESTTETNAIATLDIKLFERLRRAVKSRAYSQYLEREQVPSDWNAASSFFEVGIPIDQMGTGTNPKDGKRDRNTNRGAIVGFRDTIIYALEMNEQVISATASGGGARGSISRETLIGIVTVFNSLLETWAQALEMIGVTSPLELRITELE